MRAEDAGVRAEDARRVAKHNRKRADRRGKEISRGSALFAFGMYGGMAPTDAGFADRRGFFRRGVLERVLATGLAGIRVCTESSRSVISPGSVDFVKHL